jgi:hypothetical protein
MNIEKLEVDISKQSLNCCPHNLTSDGKRLLENGRWFKTWQAEGNTWTHLQKTGA